MTELLKRYGPCAVIAGASEGIGAAFARTLAEVGFDLVLIARRAAPLSALSDELRARHVCKVDTIELDLAASDLELQLEAIAREREVGLLVYNAALSIVGPFLGTPLADTLRMLDVNARGPLIAAHVFGSRMATRGGGGIILLSSLTAFWGSAWVATYGATKAFNLSLGEALAHELGERGVDVLVSCAGATSTPGFVQLMSGRKGPRTMSPASVVRETLGSLSKRGAFVPGKGNRLAHFVLSRALPRSWAVRIMASQTRPLL